MDIQIECFTAGEIAAKVAERYTKATDVEKLIHIIVQLENDLKTLREDQRGKFNQVNQTLHPQLGSGLGGRVLPFPQRGIIDIGPTSRETVGVGSDSDGGFDPARLRETDNRPAGPATPPGLFSPGPYVAGEPA